MIRARKMALLAAGFAAAFGFNVTTACAQSVNWNMATYAGGHWLDVGMKNFVKRVETLTEGRVKITVATPGALGSPLKVTETVHNGIAEVGHNWPGYDWGADRAGVPFGGWSGGLTPEEYMLWLYNEGGAELLREWRDEVFGVVSIACASAETELFLHSHKSVRTLEDFKGLRLRTAGAWAEIASKLGASTVVLAGGEVFSALERRVVDAIEWSGPGQNITAGFHNIAPYIIVPGVHQPASLQECMFNKAAWAKLSKRDQGLIELAGRLNFYETFLAYAKMDLDGWAKLKSGKNQIVHLDQSFIDAARKASHAWAEEQSAKGKWFKRVYEHQRAFQTKLAAWKELRIPIGANSGN